MMGPALQYSYSNIGSVGSIVGSEVGDIVAISHGNIPYNDDFVDDVSLLYYHCCCCCS